MTNYRELAGEMAAGMRLVQGDPAVRLRTQPVPRHLTDCQDVDEDGEWCGDCDACDREAKIHGQERAAELKGDR